MEDFLVNGISQCGKTPGCLAAWLLPACLHRSCSYAEFMRLLQETTVVDYRNKFTIGEDQSVTLSGTAHVDLDHLN